MKRTVITAALLLSASAVHSFDVGISAGAGGVSADLGVSTSGEGVSVGVGADAPGASVGADADAETGSGGASVGTGIDAGDASAGADADAGSGGISVGTGIDAGGASVGAEADVGRTGVSVDSGIGAGAGASVDADVDAGGPTVNAPPGGDVDAGGEVDGASASPDASGADSAGSRVGSEDSTVGPAARTPGGSPRSVAPEAEFTLTDLFRERSRNGIELPCSLRACGGNRGNPHDGPGAGILETDEQTPQAVVAACEETARVAADPYGMTDISVADRGRTERVADGGYRAPLYMRIVYETEAGYELREAPVWCEFSEEGVVDDIVDRNVV